MESTNAISVGEGAQAEVIRIGDRAVKLYRAGHSMEEARQEARLQALAAAAGLPVPQVYGVEERDGRPAVLMEYLAGASLGDLAGDPDQINMDEVRDPLDTAIALQRQVHRVKAEGFPSLKGKLTWKLERATALSDEQRARLLEELASLPEGDSLCHGDFHLFNLMQTPGGVCIIDWVDAFAGCPEADICRSYLLYRLHRHELGELYLDHWLNTAGGSRREILRWLPVLAGARFTEIVRAGDAEQLMEMIADSQRV